jgi:hypothetical protein
VCGINRSATLSVEHFAPCTGYLRFGRWFDWNSPEWNGYLSFLWISFFVGIVSYPLQARTTVIHEAAIQGHCKAPHAAQA